MAVLPKVFVKWASGLRLPWLAGIVGSLFLIDLILPDPLPLIEEVFLGLATVALVRWKKERGDEIIVDATEVPPDLPTD